MLLMTFVAFDACVCAATSADVCKVTAGNASLQLLWEGEGVEGEGNATATA